MNRYYSYPKIENWDMETESKTDFGSGVISLAKGSQWIGPNYDFPQMVHTKTGLAMAEAADLEVRFHDIYDPGLRELWENRGLEYVIHEMNGETWVSFAPKSAAEGNKQYPVILCFRPAGGRFGVFAQGFYRNLIEIAAQDELILLIFSTEDAEKNEMYMDILQEAKTLYPIDPTRVYLTGHSHYGEFALNFMRNHFDVVTAVAQQGDRPGLPLGKGTYGIFAKEHLDEIRAHDIPLIDVAGWAEMNELFPVNTDAPDKDRLTEMGKRSNPTDKPDRIAAWRNRLYAWNCPLPSDEAFEVNDDWTKAEVMLGFPADHSETLFVDGLEVYIGDVKNTSGKNHLRIVAIENLTHTTCEFMHTIAWSFLRRFAKNPETGETVELWK